MSSGDAIAQCWLEQVPIQKIDWSRTARFGIIGCAFVVIFFREINFETNLTIFFFQYYGPLVRTWYLTMERFVGSGVTIQKTLTKVGLDQFGFSPIFTSGILTMIGLFQGQTLGSIKTKLDNELLDIVVNGWKVRILFTNPLCSRNFQNVKLRSSYTRIYLPLNFG